MAGVHGASFLAPYKRLGPHLLPLPTLLPERGSGRGWLGNLVWGGGPSLPSSPAQLPSPFSCPPELNFGAITLNSMDATSERDFVGESWGPACLSPGATPLHCALICPLATSHPKSGPTGGFARPSGVRERPGDQKARSPFPPTSRVPVLGFAVHDPPQQDG